MQRILKTIEYRPSVLMSRVLSTGALLIVAILYYSSLITQLSLAQGLIIEEEGTLMDVYTSFADGIIPGDSGMYVPPTDSDIKQMRQLLAMVVNSIRTNDTVSLTESSLEASRLGCELARLTNKKKGTVYYILREAAGRNRGWGLYIFRAGNGSSDLVIEAPHPVYDLHTDNIAILAFEKSKARAFLLAGSHRNANPDGSADVSHSPKSIFQLVHEVVTDRSTIVINIHGFSLTNQPGYPQIVLSSGDGKETLPVIEISSILETENFTIGVVNGENLKELEAANDIQGKYTNSIGAGFIHMELESSLRKSPSQYKKVIAAITEFDSRYLKKTGSEKFPIVISNLPDTDSKHSGKSFLNQLEQEFNYYLAATLVMVGGFIMLFIERRKSKI